MCPGPGSFQTQVFSEALPLGAKLRNCPVRGPRPIHISITPPLGASVDPLCHIYTIYDRTFGDFSAKITVFTLCVYGFGQPYLFPIITHNTLYAHTADHTHNFVELLTPPPNICPNCISRHLSISPILQGFESVQ